MGSNGAAVLLGNGRPMDTALICGERSSTYDELRNSVARAAGAWRSLGVARGDRVAVRLADGMPWVDAYLGCMWAGAIAIAVNPRAPAAEWDKIQELANFDFVLADFDEGLPAPSHGRAIDLKTWLDRQRVADPIEAAQADADDAAFWTLSSGTSGKPKLIIHGHRFALEIERIVAEVVGVGPQDRLFATSKLFFTYPQTNALCAGLKLGASIVIDPEWPTPERVANTVRNTRPTVLFSVPSMYRGLLKEGLAPGLMNDGVSRFVSAGEALSPELRDEWSRQTGKTIINGYGASETLALVLIDRGDGRGMRASPGVTVEPLKGAGDRNPTRVSIDAPTVALGYLNLPEEQREHFRDGCFCPSDLFAYSDDGSWRFAGREGSLVKVSGRWLDLVAIEEKLAHVSPHVLEAAAVIVPDEDGLDALAVFYVPSSDESAEHAEAILREHAETMPTYQRPRWLHRIEALPRTATGKLIRRRLQEMARSG